MKVERYVEPAEFERWRETAEAMGFLYVASGPLVRSSYKVSRLLRGKYGRPLISLVLRPESFSSRTCSINDARPLPRLMLGDWSLQGKRRCR
jgi:hypothetical protein